MTPTAIALTFLTFFIACLLSYVAGSAVVYFMLSPKINRLEELVRELHRLEAKLRELQENKPPESLEEKVERLQEEYAQAQKRLAEAQLKLMF